MCPMDCSCIEGKNKTPVKILGGRQHRTTPAGQILGGRDPCNPCVVDAYDLYRANLITRCDDGYAVAKFSKFGVSDEVPEVTTPFIDT